MRAGAAPRVAFFTDCYYEVNGVARTSRELVRYARERELPLLAVHAGAETRVWKEGSVTHCEFRRGFPSLRLDADMAFDLGFYWRHRKPVEAALLEFGPEVIHGTGPSDCGLLGLILAHRYRVPMLATWHTNVHEYAGRRVRIPGVEKMAEQASLSLVSLYYRYARRTLAPNPELVALLETRTGRPSGLMERGIDTSQFQPGKRVRECDGSFRIGYVGRLSREKNVRLLVDIQDMLRAAGAWPFHFCVVGQGDELGYLRRRLEGAIFPGVLRGEALSRAYADS